nr:non-canonical purine NTP pyrophosphatase [Anaerocolumna sedimenticola]
MKGILKLMNGVNNRYCEFKSCLAYYDGSIMQFFESKSPGKLSEKIKGRDNQDKWSDLWYIFIPDKFSKTLAEFDKDDFEIYNGIKEDSCMKKFGLWYETR